MSDTALSLVDRRATHPDRPVASGAEDRDERDGGRARRGPIDDCDGMSVFATRGHRGGGVSIQEPLPDGVGSSIRTSPQATCVATPDEISVTGI